MTTTGNDEGMALLLQASRDFALGQMAQGRRLVPFGARVATSGEIDFIRYVDEDTDMPLADVYDRTQAALAKEAGAGTLVAVASVAAVGGAPGEFGDGFDSAIRVHLESPGYSRVMVSPFRFEQEPDAEVQLHIGEMLVMEVRHVVFAGSSRA